MSKLVELYVREVTREGTAMTIEDVPARLREQVAAVIEQRKDAEWAGE